MSQESKRQGQPRPPRGAAPQGTRAPQPRVRQQAPPARPVRPRGVLFDEDERTAMQRSARPQETSFLAVWVTLVPVIILLIVSLVLSVFLYKEARQAASENLRLTRELKQAHEEIEVLQSRLDGHENEIQNIKQAIQTLQEWNTQE